MLVALLTLMVIADLPQSAEQKHQDHHAALDARGQQFMGFDQKATTHHFLLSKDGGRIEVTVKDPGDAVSLQQVQSHLQHIAAMFSDGNFEVPMLVHAKQPPGVEQMKQAGKAITYTYEAMAQGGRVRLTTSDPSALSGVHAFLRFQIQDHRTGDPLVVK